MAIDWTYLKQRGGENFELLLATLLRREIDGLRQVNPDQGDGGVDLVKETDEGARVWQAKAFTTPLTSSQMTQIEKSWKRFIATNVDAGKKVAAYTLVTPWTPTTKKMDWFIQLTKGVDFPVAWDSAAFINGIAAAHPDVVTLYERGPGAFDEMVAAKAMLASTTPGSEPATMLEAVAVRESALRDLRDRFDPNYILNVSERTSAVPGRAPVPAPTEVGVMHRMENLDGDRWRIETVVPRHADAGAADPITGTLHFSAKRGSSEEAALLEFQTWGVPLRDFIAEVETKGGPFAQPRHKSQLSIGTPALDQNLPDLMLRLVDAKDTTVDTCRLRIRERTQGFTGGGLRLIARSLWGNVELELRFGSEIAPDGATLNFPTLAGARPSQIVTELAWLDQVATDSALIVEMEGGGPVMGMTNLNISGAAPFILRVGRDLVTLQSHTDNELLMPTIEDITQEQFETLVQLSDIYSGTPQEGTWEGGEVTVDDPSALSILNGTGSMVEVKTPVFDLGETEYVITRELVTTYLTPQVAEGTDLSAVEPGGVVKLVPGADNRVVTAVLVDDRPSVV